MMKRRTVLLLLAAATLETASSSSTGGRGYRSLWVTDDELEYMENVERSLSHKGGSSPTRAPWMLPPRTPRPTPFSTPSPTPGPTQQAIPASSVPNPTPEPTPEPTPDPTPDPTPLPTPRPRPTPEPTPGPTPDPTPDPTPQPTPRPTQPTTSRPSGRPSESAAPTQSSRPTTTASASPTGSPVTPSPTPGPSPFPTTQAPSPSPTESPITPSPTPATTSAPTQAPPPTQSPSLVPTGVPTEDVVGTVTTTNNDGEAISTSFCQEDPPDAAPAPSSRELTFQYTLRVESSGTTFPPDVVRDVEGNLHEFLAQEYLGCDFSEWATRRRRLQPPNEDEFTLVSLSTNRPDAVSTTSNCTSEEETDGLECHVVDGSIFVEYILTGTLENVLASFGTSIGQALASLDGQGGTQLTFRGFTDVTVGGTESDENGDATPVGAEEQPTPSEDKSNTGKTAGVAVVAGAAVALAGIGFLVVRRRRGRQMSYLEQPDDDNSAAYSVNNGKRELRKEPGTPDTASPLDASFESAHLGAVGVEVALGATSEDIPTFQQTKILISPDMVAEIQTDLGPKRSSSTGSRSYRMPDTVAL